MTDWRPVVRPPLDPERAAAEAVKEASQMLADRAEWPNIRKPLTEDDRILLRNYEAAKREAGSIFQSDGFRLRAENHARDLFAEIKRRGLLG